MGSGIWFCVGVRVNKVTDGCRSGTESPDQAHGDEKQNRMSALIGVPKGRVGARDFSLTNEFFGPDATSRK